MTLCVPVQTTGIGKGRKLKKKTWTLVVRKWEMLHVAASKVKMSGSEKKKWSNMTFPIQDV